MNRYGVAIKKVKKIYIPEYTKKRDGVANIEPKVNEPFELIPRRIPRAAVIDSLQKLFSSVKIEEILKKADVDFSRPEFNHSKLDLHHFDDKLYDIYPNEYWIKKCTIEKGKMLKIPGIALFFDKTVRIGEWKKVLISEYDAVQETFSGNIEDSNKTPFKKQKIFILFDAENPFVYAKRIIDALNTREIAENKIKYNYLLSKIPKIDKLNDLPELRKTKILNLISNTKDLSLVENSIAEEIMKINNSYFLTLNKLMFNRLYYNRQTAELCVGNLKIKQDPVEEIALYAKERLPPYDYNDLSTKLNTKFLLCKKFIIDVINEIKENSNKMIEEMNLFKVNFTNTIKIDEFKKAEKNHFTAFKMKMEQEKIGEIKKVLKRISVKTEDDHFEIDFVVKKIQKKRKCVFEEDKRKERYVEVLMQEINKHKTISFIGLINSIVKDALYSLVCKSIVSFIMFFENLIPVTVEVKSANEVVNTYDPSYFKKIKNISQSKINLKIPNAFGRETDCPDRDLNTTFDIENYSLGGSYNRPPMFHLTIMYREGQFEYNYKIEDLISEVKRIFDDGLDKVQKIQQIVFDKETTQHLFYKLIHRHKPINISNINNQDQNEKFNQKEMEWIDEIYERLGTTLLLGKQPLDKYLTMFEPYKEYFNFNAEQYVKNYDEDKSDPNINNKIRDDIVKFQKIKDKFQKQIPETIQVSYFLVNCKEIRDSLIRLFDKIIELELGLLDKNAKELKTMINKSIDDIKKDITKTGKNIDEVVNIERFIEDVPGMLESTKLEIENCLFIYKILDDFHSKSSYGDIRSRLMLLNGPTSVLDTISSFKTMLAKSREKFAEELDDNQAKLREDMIVLDKNVKSLMNYDSLSTMSEAAQLARNLENNFVDFKEKVKIYNNREIYFGREQTDYSKLLEMYKEFEPFFQIWTNSDNFLNKKKIWLMEDFSNLKGEEVRTVNENVLRNIVMSIKKLKDKGLEKTFDKVIKIAEEMKRQTEEFKPISNLAVFLTTEGLTERHWSDLKNIGIDCISNREGLTLDKLVANMKAGNDGKISNEVINVRYIIYYSKLV